MTQLGFHYRKIILDCIVSLQEAETREAIATTQAGSDKDLSKVMIIKKLRRKISERFKQSG